MKHHTTILAILLALSLGCKTQQTRKEAAKRPEKDIELSMYIVINPKGTTMKLLMPQNGRTEMHLPKETILQHKEDPIENTQLLELRIGGQSAVGRVSTADIKTLRAYHDYTELKTFNGPLADFSSGCFLTPEAYNTYKSCSGCDIISFKPNGVFEGRFGCDTVVSGQWRKTSYEIVVNYKEFTMCNHYIPPDTIDNKAKRDAFCTKFQRVSTYTGQIHIKRQAVGGHTAELPGRAEAPVEGQLYTPYYVK